MKSLNLQKEVSQMTTISDLTGIFESIASMRISRVKAKVETSQIFFAEIWAVYSQLRVDSDKRFSSGPKRKKQNVFLLLTGQGGLSGDIDERIIKRMLKDYDATTTDLIVIGAHGVALLAQRGIIPQQTFRLPDSDDGVDVTPIIAAIAGYTNPSVFYQKYVSLSVQDPDRIDLHSRVQGLANASEIDVISPHDYLFEPSVDEVVGYLESVMLGIALGQVILESRLAQYASRFSAMSAAHKTASEMVGDSVLSYHRAKRLEGDERLKEVITAMKLI